MSCKDLWDCETRMWTPGMGNWGLGEGGELQGPVGPREQYGHPPVTGKWRLGGLGEAVSCKDLWDLESRRWSPGMGKGGRGEAVSCMDLWAPETGIDTPLQWGSGGWGGWEKQ